MVNHGAGGQRDDNQTPIIINSSLMIVLADDCVRPIVEAFVLHNAASWFINIMPFLTFSKVPYLLKRNDERRQPKRASTQIMRAKCKRNDEPKRRSHLCFHSKLS